MKFFAVLALCIVAACAAPLTGDEAHLIQDSWSKVHHNEIDILANFFEKYPEHQARFPAFVGKDLATLKETAKFATHATRIISALSEVIELSGNTETAPALKTVLTTLGSDHKRRGIPKESFTDFKVAFFSYLEANAPYGANVQAAWAKAFENAYTILMESY